MRKKFSSLEQTFVLLKPDAVSRGLVGKIFQRFEELGMKMVAGRLVKAKKEQVKKHYPFTKEWLVEIGNKSVKAYKGDKEALKKDYGTSNREKIGKIVHKALVDYMTSGPVIISVWEGNHAVERVRKLVGYAVPTYAEVGSIRERYAFDTQPLAIHSGRIAFKNLIHASGDKEEARREIKIWFGKKFKDLSNYERVDYLDIF
jgi:nucleoside-diphosphate kinase